MSKTLSNGTLSLRFMQNALRRQQLDEVELVRAEVKDEGKWEVGSDVKEAWGIDQGPRGDSVSYESSYLPFMFSSEHDDATAHPTKPLGRRLFSKNGQDVSQPAATNAPNNNDDEQLLDDNVEGSSHGNDNTKSDVQRTMKGRKYRVHAKPTPISSISMDRRDLKGFEKFEKQGNSKSARDAIFSLEGVGTDLRSSKKPSRVAKPDTGSQQRAETQRNSSSTTTFLKPLGVDEPAPSSKPRGSGSKSNPSNSPFPDIIDGARKKRSREANEAGEEGTKKKKKKQLLPSQAVVDAE